MRVFHFIFAVLICCCGISHAALVNGIVAIVNDAVITYDQVERGIAPLAEVYIRQYRTQPQVLAQKLQELRAQQIEELVERQLVLADFKSAGYNLPENFIDDAVKEEIRKNFFGDRAKLTKTLQAEGLTYEAFRQQQRERIIFNYLKDQNTSSQKILISPYKIETFYSANQEQFKLPDQIKLRLVVVNQSPDAAPGTAKKLADEILKKIEEGTSFAEMASIYSDGAQKADGGNRGWVDRTYLKKELTDVAFSLKAGQHSSVIELPEGCYLIQVDEVRPAHIRPIDQVRDEIENTLKAQESARLRKKWIDRLKNKSFVRYF